jgi:hypothetical protein
VIGVDLSISDLGEDGNVTIKVLGPACWLNPAYQTTLSMLSVRQLY